MVVTDPKHVHDPELVSLEGSLYLLALARVESSRGQAVWASAYGIGVDCGGCPHCILTRLVSGPSVNQYLPANGLPVPPLVAFSTDSLPLTAKVVLTVEQLGRVVVNFIEPVAS